VAAEGSVECFLIPEVDAIAKAMQVFEAAGPDALRAPGDEVDEEETGVEVGSRFREAQFAPRGDPEAGGDEGDTLIGDGEGDGWGSGWGVPEFADVGEDEHVAIEPENAGEVLGKPVGE